MDSWLYSTSSSGASSSSSVPDLPMSLSSISSGELEAAAPKDPLTPLPEDVLTRITGFLDAKSLSRGLGCVNRTYRGLCGRNEAGWDHLCLDRWRDKVHVAAAALAEPDRRRAYRLSVQDARERNHVTEDEFCYNPDTGRGTVWSFRFKESAGSDWTSHDPWYQGRPARKMVFLKDGSVREFVPAADRQQQQQLLLQGESLVASAAAAAAAGGAAVHHDPQHDDPLQLLDEERRGFVLQPPHFGGQTGTIVDPPMQMSWRFLRRRPMDLPGRPFGSYVRFTVGGRDVPTYAVRRSPTGNWGFVMESCWGVYASFELPPRRHHHLARRRPSTTQQSEGGVVWIDDDGGGDDNDEHETNVQDNLLQDESLQLTNEIQWREAFLYNVGARVLPEGDEATDEFDRAWGQT
jgi:hypothetical protein